MKKAEQTIIDIISNRVAVINMHAATTEEWYEKRAAELNGMLICLKNINDNAWSYWVNSELCTNGAWHFSFGYYDDAGRWVELEA